MQILAPDALIRAWNLSTESGARLRSNGFDTGGVGRSPRRVRDATTAIPG